MPFPSPRQNQKPEPSLLTSWVQILLGPVKEVWSGAPWAWLVSLSSHLQIKIVWFFKTSGPAEIELRLQLGCVFYFPGSSDGKVSVCNAGDPGSIPGSGRSPGGGNGNPLQYSCLERPMERGAWWARVHGVPKELDMT